MTHQTLLGELVVLSARWDLGAEKLGLVIYQGKNSSRVLVLWTEEGKNPNWTWHLAEAVVAIDESNIQKVRQRCHLAT